MLSLSSFGYRFKFGSEGREPGDLGVLDASLPPRFVHSSNELLSGAAGCLRPGWAAGRTETRTQSRVRTCVASRRRAHSAGSESRCVARGRPGAPRAGGKLTLGAGGALSRPLPGVACWAASPWQPVAAWRAGSSRSSNRLAAGPAGGAAGVRRPVAGPPAGRVHPGGGDPGGRVAGPQTSWASAAWRR